MYAENDKSESAILCFRVCAFLRRGAACARDLYNDMLGY